MPTLRRPTVTLHYDDDGPRDAPAVVLAHSLLCDRTMWGPVAADLARTHRVLNLDLRGHGRSSPASALYSLDAQCDDLPALLDAVGVRRATLVGLSWGGMLSMRAAIFHPTRVAGLCLFDTSAEPERPADRARFVAMAATFRAVGPLPVIEAEVRRKMFSDGFAARTPEAVTKLTDSIRAASREGLFQGTLAVATRGDLLPLLGDVRAPTVVVVGDEDRATPPSRADRIAARIPGATVERLRGTGHLAAIEQPELVTLAIRSFLERTAEPAP
ncbi:MAG: alpha/beta fold hydrolase [Polyangiales bacterium]